MNSKVDILSNKVINVLKEVYTPEYGFAEKYNLTDLDLSIGSNYYNYKKFSSEIFANIDKAITELSGMKQHVVFKFPEDGRTIILHVLGLKNIAVNLNEVFVMINGITLKESILRNRQYCIPLFFCEEVNLNKAHKWIKYQLSQMFEDKRIASYTDFGADSGVVRSIYLTRKGETASSEVYRDIINQIHDGNTQISIELGESIEPYKDLCKEDLQIKLDEEFGINSIRISSFETMVDLSTDGIYRLVVVLENVFPLNTAVQLDVISKTYEDTIKPALDNMAMYSTCLMLNYEVEDRKDSFLSFIESHINRILGYENLDLLESISVDWGRGKDTLVLHIHSK